MTMSRLRGLVGTLAVCLSLLLTTRSDGRPLAGLPVARMGPLDYAPYDPVRILLSATWPGRDSLRDELDICLKPFRADPWALYPGLSSVAPGFMGGVCLSPELTTPQARNEAATGALKALEAEAAASGCALAALLYVPDDPASPLPAAARELGWKSAVIAGESRLEVRWSSFDEYLASRSRDRRQSIRAEIRSFAQRGLRIDVGGAEALDDSLAPLHAQWRSKYGRAVAPADLVRQYALARRHLADSIQVFLARRGDRTVAFSLFYEHAGVLYSRALGFDYAETARDFTYFNLLFYEPIKAAIEQGLYLIHYSLESYETKVRRGCRVRPCRAYVKPLNGAAARLCACLPLLDAGMSGYIASLEGRPAAGASP